MDLYYNYFVFFPTVEDIKNFIDTKWCVIVPKTITPESYTIISPHESKDQTQGKEEEI